MLGRWFSSSCRGRGLSIGDDGSKVLQPCNMKSIPIIEVLFSAWLDRVVIAHLIRFYFDGVINIVDVLTVDVGDDGMGKVGRVDDDSWAVTDYLSRLRSL